MNKRTCLYSEHLALEAKFCPFAGYEMPINYPLGVIKEHEWTRENAGLFDVSHMGQAIVRTCLESFQGDAKASVFENRNANVRNSTCVTEAQKTDVCSSPSKDYKQVLSGLAAAAFCSRITPSSFMKTANGRAKYTLLTNDNGGIIDDLIITKIADDKFFLVFNAGRKEIDIVWMKKNLPLGVTFTELENNALIALQGPKAESVLANEFPDVDFSKMNYMTMLEASWKDFPVFISRLGYTGEDGFEISIASDAAILFWNSLLANKDVRPVGLAARDSLRLEMGYPLYGHDLTENTTPIEAGLKWTMSKGHQGYFGAGILIPELEKEPKRKRVGVKLLESGIAREGSSIFSGDEKIGELTSGGFSPSLKFAIGQGYVKSEFAQIGREINVEVRGRKIAAIIHELNFLPAKTKSSSSNSSLNSSLEKKVS